MRERSSSCFAERDRRSPATCPSPSGRTCDATAISDVIPEPLLVGHETSSFVDRRREQPAVRLPSLLLSSSVRTEGAVRSRQIRDDLYDGARITVTPLREEDGFRAVADPMRRAHLDMLRAVRNPAAKASKCLCHCSQRSRRHLLQPPLSSPASDGSGRPLGAKRATTAKVRGD